MEKKGSTSFSISFFFFFLLTVVVSYSSLVASQNHNITTVFTFDDSTLDPGNNNNIPTSFKSNHPPYGRDFNGGIATGRFTDGKLVTDMVVSSLGIKDFLPAYFEPKITNHDLLTGVSFASAGSGLDDQTPDRGGVIHMSTQLVKFQECLARIQATVGDASAAQIIQNAIFTIGAGTNDMIINYYDLPTRRLEFSPPAYHDLLLRKLETSVTITNYMFGIHSGLYKMGARKLIITGLPPIGCLPVQATVGSITPGPDMLERICEDQQNEDAQAYNIKLQGYIKRWQEKLSGSKIVYADIYNPLMDMIQNPSKYGSQETMRGCGGTGYVEVGGLCNNMMVVCSDPSKYIFFDAIHPTAAAYKHLANVILQTVLPSLGN
ncbi:hypothetical protein NE237_010159 [Protea cynaroides]|uniref:Uncharacterized protein n=1 Tax=Protea cynaroides TaxID=273540 RepID=A0A9Q0R1B6_9MAGN|nr:hypothetical protein NE237_010159 [Protea cynaroides]